MTLTSEEIEQITYPLKHYHLNKYHAVTDYETIIKNRTEIEEDGQTIYKYECPNQDIYLDTNHYAVDYDKQHVITTFFDEDDFILNNENGTTPQEYDHVEVEVYYEYHPDSIVGTYTYLNTYEWMKTLESEAQLYVMQPDYPEPVEIDEGEGD